MDEVALDIVCEANRIERTKVGQPLTPNEIKTIAAATLLRATTPDLAGTEAEYAMWPVKES